MRHRKKGPQLGRTPSHRKALLRNLAAQLLRHERIETTQAKAKALRPFAERLITLGKKETLHARRRAAGILQDPDVVRKIFDTLAPRYAQRPGGYTRILKLPTRKGDRAEMAIIELVEADTAATATQADDVEAEAGPRTAAQDTAERIQGDDEDE